MADAHTHALLARLGWAWVKYAAEKPCTVEREKVGGKVSRVVHGG